MAAWLILAALAIQPPAGLPLPQPMPSVEAQPDPQFWRELGTPDLPPITDRYRFCGGRRENCRAWMDYNRAVAGRWATLGEWNRDRSERFTEAIAECEWAWRTYDLLDDAWHNPFPEWRQRIGLLRLRERIGRERYDRGELPPPVPFWRFEELK